MTNFELVADLNTAFGNAEGNPRKIDWGKVIAQCLNIFDEFIELQKALGADDATLEILRLSRQAMEEAEYSPADLDGVRDALCDIHVFGYGAHHLMGIDANRDMASAISGVMTRFIKDEEDEVKTIKHHASRGVTKVTLEGEYPRRILRSTENQPDAPKGKFLKSASCQQPRFYAV